MGSVTHRGRRLTASLAAAAAVWLIAGCGSGSHPSRTGPGSRTSSAAPTTITYVEPVFPQSLDPAVDASSAGEEVNWLVYTGLLTYRHADGAAGTQLIPGLATALPVITDGGRTYTVTLRRGEVYSDGQRVQARDFRYALERALRVPGGVAGERLRPMVQGAAAFAAGAASTVSGIHADDRTGRIVIHLTAPSGGFDSVLAEPALGLIPWGSRPFRAQGGDPPPGDGPYMVRHIVAGRSFSVVRNPRWRPVPGIRSGQVDIDVAAGGGVRADVDAVLNDTADVLDWSATIPGGLASEIRAKAPDRFRLGDLGAATAYFFLNTREAPFDRQLARAAVLTGLDETALDRAGSGTLEPACYLLPPTVAGAVSDTTAPCPYGMPGTGDLARARRLLQRSGEDHAPVTVWAPDGGPEARWASEYVQLLDRIGFRASLRRVADPSYPATIGTASLHPQTGVAEAMPDGADPVTLYRRLLDGRSIPSVGNANFGEVDDPTVNAALERLSRVPVADLSRATPGWQALQREVARRAYLAVFGYRRFPFFMSSRMNFAAAVHSPIYGWDWSSFQLK